MNKYSDKSEKERILLSQKSLWIGYPIARKIMSKMENLLSYPEAHRMPNILLVGDSNNGKTSLLNRFLKEHQSYVDKETGELIAPVVAIQAPPEPDEKRFYAAILESMNAPYRSSENAETRRFRVGHLLKKVKVRILMIDEIHHILAGTMNRQRLFLNLLRHLSNDLKICLVCAGTRDAFNAISTDSQLSNRFEPNVLPKWDNEMGLWRFLETLETFLPLKNESLLSEPGMVSKILAMSEGLIGEMTKIVELATILAIETETEKITKGILDNIDFVPPSQRRKLIQRL